MSRCGFLICHPDLVVIGVFETVSVGLSDNFTGRGTRFSGVGTGGFVGVHEVG